MGKLKQRFAGRRGTLAKNTFFLYILIFSSYVLGAITIPYQTRVMGPQIYGKLNWAIATMAYFALLVDFGYMLSGTEQVARNRENREEIERIVGGITINKVVTVLIGLVVLVPLAFTWSKMNTDPWFYILVYFSTVSASFMLDFFYRGIEQMKVITMRTVGIRVIFTICIFIFLREPADYWVVPAMSLIGDLLSLGFVYYYMVRKLGYRIVFPNWRYCWKLARYSSIFFYSRVAASVYSSTNMFLVGIINPVGALITGAYASADKILQTMRLGLGPIADSLYPYMVRNRDFKLLKKLLIWLMPPVVIGATIIAIWAEPICVFILGSEYAQAGELLRLMMPIFVVTLPIFLLSFPTLGAMGHSRAVNNSVFAACAVHVVLLAVLYATSTLSAKSIIWCTLFTQIIELAYCVAAIYKYRAELKPAEAEPQATDAHLDVTEARSESACEEEE
ncbi:oligosaccharide flippase family protein [Gleimia hominis]|uniref:Oligosaccharide flippase family protein n=1 Tax=Gleimia hominis TaxID=595468 RepID=A0ABU3IA20_9ACTO|nr:oligosaccharide flippase family protein [Gleimia hominis]MDT3767220.1 oligosaccharide flippase family protein [Gleimia hominis]